MAQKMQPEIVSREIVKPSSSTPKNNQTIHKLSFFDQISPRVYVPLLFFYKTKHSDYNNNHKSHLLKFSLSDALSEFYPLAGRHNDDVSVECNDEGVAFLEARMECNLSEILKIPDYETMNHLIPDSLYYKDSTLSSLVMVQAKYFRGGAMSIGLCLCHKMLDMSSMCSFIKKWTSVARNFDGKISPEFDIGSLYPPLDLPIQLRPPPQKLKNYISRRLVFDARNITKLKEIVADQVPNATRVEVVTSLLYKSAISANAKASLSGSLKPTVLLNTMNLRTLIFPPLPEEYVGNLSGMFPVFATEGKEVELGSMVKEFRDEKTWFSNSVAKICNEEELYALVLDKLQILRPTSDGPEGYCCSSWCRFPLYEAVDFGWGKPFWVTTVCWGLKNVIAMMDTKEEEEEEEGGGDIGIEAFVSLEEKAMDVFELDEQLLEFCRINPSVCEIGHFD